MRIIIHTCTGTGESSTHRHEVCRVLAGSAKVDEVQHVGGLVIQEVAPASPGVCPQSSAQKAFSRHLCSTGGRCAPASHVNPDKRPAGMTRKAQSAPVGVRLHEAPVEQLVQRQLQQTGAHCIAHLRGQMLHLYSAKRAFHPRHKHAAHYIAP